ncbi:hypothetical protein FXO37_36209 [Capsicum annuum]|nr:hypothetical protein FXO37_36209 [Capsicum annuum]
MVELNGDGQGSDNGSNLLVRFLGRFSQKSVFCPISVLRLDRMPKHKKQVMWKIIELRNDNFYPNKSKEELLEKTPKEVDSIVEWTAFMHHYHDEKMKEQKLGRPVCRSEVILSTLLKKDGNFVNEEGKILVDKISEHLPKDQKFAISYGVPSKILAHPNDAIGKVFGSEHSRCVHGLGGNVCPSKVFGMSKNSHVHLGSSSSISRQRVEDLEKQVETLKEKLTGYEETNENLTTVHSFLQSKFGSELPTLN